MNETTGSKKPWLIAGLALGLVLVLAAGVWWGRPAYKRFKERRGLAQARSFIEQRDERGAALALRQTLQANPANLEATRLMAELAGAAQSPAALALWQRVAELSPTSENKLLLAATGLRIERPPYPIAVRTLDELRARGETNTGFQLVVSQLALKLNRLGEAAAYLEVAARLEPTNRLHQLNLATLRLQARDPALVAQARAELVALAADPKLGDHALRALTAEALGQGRAAAAREFSEQLLARPAATFADQLQHLSVLEAGQSGDLAAALGRVRQTAATNTAFLAQTVIWMIGHAQAAAARDWLGTLPPDLRTNLPIPLVEADCLVAVRDWPALENHLREQRWKDMEFLRFAYRSLAAEQIARGDGVMVDGHWRAAVREAGERLGALSTLVTLADKWKRPDARDELLWRIGQRFPAEHWAYRELHRLYAAAGNTRGLNKLYEAMLNSDPGNVVHKNNFAATSLLLKAQLPRAHQLAREIFAAAPQAAVPVSTYAYSLHVQGKSAEGLAALQKLEPSAMTNQPVALYYGRLLWAVGQTNEAAPFLAVAARATDLLPEEKTLLAECRPGRGP